MAGQTACQSSSTSGGLQLSTNISGFDEGAQHSCLCRSQCQFIRRLSDGRVRENRAVELGSDRFDRLRVPPKVHRLVVVLAGPPELVCDFEVCTSYKLASERTHEILAPTLQWCVTRNTFTSLGS